MKSIVFSSHSLNRMFSWRYVLQGSPILWCFHLECSRVPQYYFVLTLCIVESPESRAYETIPILALAHCIQHTSRDKNSNCNLHINPAHCSSYKKISVTVFSMSHFVLHMSTPLQSPVYLPFHSPPLCCTLYSCYRPWSLDSICSLWLQIHRNSLRLIRITPLNLSSISLRARSWLLAKYGRSDWESGMRVWESSIRFRWVKTKLVWIRSLKFVQKTRV